MKTVVQINSVANCGSTGRIAEQIGLLAKAQGWRSIMVHGAPRFSNNSSLETIQCVTPLGERINAIQSRLFDNHGLSGANATRHVVRLIEESHPDIVHLHNIHGYHINYKILFEYLQYADCKVVWTLHDCWVFTGHCAYFDLAGCEKWKTQCKHCSQKRDYPASYGLNRAAENYRIKRQLFTSLGDRLTLVPVSNWLADLIGESFLKGTHVNTIHNGIDINAFHQIEQKRSLAILENYKIQYREVENKKIVLGCASGWGKRKGYNDFKKIRELLPADQYAIMMVGLNEKQLEEMSSHGIIGIARTNSVGDLAALYSLADVFINPTYEDNYPTTNLEALACGTPVITYRTGGSPEAIDDKTGVVIAQGDVAALAEAIKQMMSNPLSSTACRQRAERLFDKDKCFERYVELYEDLLG